MPKKEQKFIDKILPAEIQLLFKKDLGGYIYGRPVIDGYANIRFFAQEAYGKSSEKQSLRAKSVRVESSKSTRKQNAPALNNLNKEQLESLAAIKRLNDKEEQDNNESISWLKAIDPLKLLNPIAPAYVAIEYTKSTIGAWLDSKLGRSTDYNSDSFFEKNKEKFRFGLKALLQLAILPFEALAIAGVKIPNIIIDQGRVGYEALKEKFAASSIANNLSAQASSAWSNISQTLSRKQSKTSSAEKPFLSTPSLPSTPPEGNQKGTIPRDPPNSPPGTRGFSTSRDSLINAQQAKPAADPSLSSEKRNSMTN